MVQGELFREEDAISRLGNSAFAKKKNFLSRFQIVITLDKLLIGFIGFTVIFVLTYSFGVERGKRVMEQNLQTMFPSQPNTTTSTSPIPAEAPSTAPGQAETVLIVGDPVSAEAEPAQTIDLPSPVIAPAAPVILEPSLPKVDASRGKYTVQLVTYDNEKLAQKEIDRLKAKGQEGFIIPSGSYFQVCVNYFDNRTKASSFLKGFPDNNRYPDAYIRPVVR